MTHETLVAPQTAACTPAVYSGAHTPTFNSGRSPEAAPVRYIVYALEELASGRHYVGLTRRSLTERIASHLGQSRRDRRIRPGGLLAALRLMDALGQRFADCFSARILATANTADEARALEQHWIERLECRTPNGLNLMPGGSSIGGIDNGQALSVTGPDGVARTYATIIQAIAACNAGRKASGQPALEPSTVYARLAGGWTPEEALGVTTRRFFGSVRRALVFGGAVYSTLHEASEATGLLPATLSSRLHRLRKTAPDEVPQIGNDRRARRPGQHARLELPWPGTRERLSAAEFAARTGVPKATVMHRWHRARSQCPDGERLSTRALHAFLTLPRGNRRAVAGALEQLCQSPPQSAGSLPDAGVPTETP